MNEKLEEFMREIETIKRMVNGYLSTNPVLANLQIDTLGLSEKIGLSEKSHSKSQDMSLGGMTEIDGPSLELDDHSCKICVNSLGHEYCYYGPNGCPIF